MCVVVCGVCGVCVCGVCVRRAEEVGLSRASSAFKTLPAALHISFSLMEQRISSAWDQALERVNAVWIGVLRG